MDPIVSVAFTLAFEMMNPSDPEKELAAKMKALSAYRRKDPDFKKSMEAFVVAEMQSAGRDPMEGKIVISSRKASTRKSPFR